MLSVLLGCGAKNKPFDAQQWNNQGVDWWITDVRENMLKDIIESDTLVGLRKEEVIALLGKEEKTLGNAPFIFVREKYSSNIDPDYIKYLKVELDDEGKFYRVSEYTTK